jgi:DNA-binding NarL/FixJ family response regulator
MNDRVSPPGTPLPSLAAGASRSVVLVHSDPMLRATVSRWLQFRAGIKVVAEADSALEALSVVRRLPHKEGVVAAVNLDLAGEPDAFWLIRSIREYAPTVAVVAVGDGEVSSDSRAFLVGADAVVEQARGLVQWLTREDLSDPTASA